METNHHLLNFLKLQLMKDLPVYRNYQKHIMKKKMDLFSLPNTQKGTR